MKLKSALIGASALVAVTTTAALAENLVIATVNNGDMIRMQGLTNDFTEKTGHTVEWVTLEENVLRQRVTTDITTKGGAFDIMTIGMYETPIWGANGWLVPLDDLSADYDVDDLLPAMRAGLSHEGTLYAAPFYGESSMIMYRTDLMEKAGLEMPDAPTWQFIREAAAAMTDRDNDINGICLRGKAGWGEGGA
ncbi:MAG: extracellular solute-binding protein, partial [Paracoccaceae bacterium]|nr:extracellular solute-binding protein [Paracoccaceae bacterium]